MSNGNLSAKEREILDRQRKLAARFKPTAPSAPAAKKPVASKSRRPRAPSKDVIDLTKNTTNSNSKKPPPPPPAVPQKRPSKKRGLPSGPQALIAAARAKANASSVSSSTARTTSTAPKPPPPPQQKSNVPSPKLKRRKLQTSGTGEASSLAKLVQNISSSAKTGDSLNPSIETSSLPTITPDDFWKHLRDWDFCSQYALQTRQQQQQQQAAAPDNQNDDKEITAFSKKPLPNVFLNPRHYIAAWAPLCLAECRAQLLQEVTLPQNIHRMNQPIPVTTESTNARNRGRRNRDAHDWVAASEEAETAGHILIRPKDRRAGSDLSFTSNDLVLLVQSTHPMLLKDIGSNRARPPHGNDPDDPHAYRSCALIGHSLVSRNELNGLIVKVSKRKWATIGQKDMFLVKIGSNVTALREFTALCKVQSLPLRRFLLGQHLEQERNRRKLSSQQSTENLLQLLGGKESLGQGFIDYCKHKFNTSQLTAIAASAHEYGEGGFTLIKGPPGTGKTTTMTAVLNSLHIRQYNKYYEEVRRIAAQTTGSRQAGLEMARRAKPRLLVCAPSNAAVDNIILKIMEDGFIDGQGRRYNPSMIRVGVGQSDAVRAVALQTKVDAIFGEYTDAGRLDSSINGYKMELSRITQDITRLRRRLHGIQMACLYPLSKDWEIRVDEDTFDETGRVFFVNHRSKETTYEIPPPPEPGETQFPATSMPEYRAYMARVVKLVENYFSIKSHLERCKLIKSSMDVGANHFDVRLNLESHVLNNVHMVMTTLGTAGNRVLEGADKFEVVVVDEAAQSVEPASLSALQLGNRHAVLVGDPQQLPATIFNVSGRNSKYDRSLFQRLEEAGQPVYMLNEQYRMHPKISHFPRHIFYGGALLDGPNVRKPDYGNPLRGMLCRIIPNFQPFTILDLDSKEERGGTSLSNFSEARLAVHMYQQLKHVTHGLSSSSRVAVITPYAQQCRLLRQSFSEALGRNFADLVEVNTVDAFQGREANIVIFSAVRAAGSRGIGFLSDVRRMNVALTRAKHFLFVIARCQSIVVNPYWRDLVQHARETRAVVRIPLRGNGQNTSFGDMSSWPLEQPPVPLDPRARARNNA